MKTVRVQIPNKSRIRLHKKLYKEKWQIFQAFNKKHLKNNVMVPLESIKLIIISYHILMHIISYAKKISTIFQPPGKTSKVWGWQDFLLFLKEVSYFQIFSYSIYFKM